MLVTKKAAQCAAFSFGDWQRYRSGSRAILACLEASDRILERHGAISQHLELRSRTDHAVDDLRPLLKLGHCHRRAERIQLIADAPRVLQQIDCGSGIERGGAHLHRRISVHELYGPKLTRSCGSARRANDSPPQRTTAVSLAERGRASGIALRSM